MPTVDLNSLLKPAAEPLPPATAPVGPAGVVPDAAPSAPTPAAVAGYRVKLRDNPAVVVRPAAGEPMFDRLEAIERYKRECGIVSTVHPFDVEPVYE